MAANIEEKISTKLVLQVVIALIGLISAVLGIYTFFFQDKKLEVTYEILANTNVLDINADISKLDIIYGDSSLKSSNEGLRIINLRIRNTGNESILKNYYDQNDPLGLKLTGGKIIEKPELVSTSSDYIRNNLKISLDSLGKLKFSDLILEPNEFYTIKFLILHKNNVNPNLHPIGKIAGIKELSVIFIPDESKEQISFFRKTFEGNIFTQIVRALSYGVIMIILIIGVVISIEEISAYKSKAKKERLIKDFKNKFSYDSETNDNIIAIYNRKGFHYLSVANNLLNDTSKLNRIYNKQPEPEDIRNPFSIFDGVSIFSYSAFIDELIDENIVLKDGNSLFPNERKRASINQFVEFMKAHEEKIM